MPINVIPPTLDAIATARKILADDADTNLAIFVVRDLPLTKEMKLDSLAWSMYLNGGSVKEVEYILDELEAAVLFKQDTEQALNGLDVIALLTQEEG